MKKKIIILSLFIYLFSLGGECALFSLAPHTMFSFSLTDEKLSSLLVKKGSFKKRRISKSLSVSKQKELEQKKEFIEDSSAGHCGYYAFIDGIKSLLEDRSENLHLSDIIPREKQLDFLRRVNQVSPREAKFQSLGDVEEWVLMRDSKSLQKDWLRMMRRISKEYLPSSKEWFVGTELDYKEFLWGMEYGSSWMEHADLVALYRYFQIPILVLQDDGYSFIPDDISPDTSTVILLSNPVNLHFTHIKSSSSAFRKEFIQNSIIDKSITDPRRSPTHHNNLLLRKVREAKSQDQYEETLSELMKEKEDLKNGMEKSLVTYEEDLNYSKILTKTIEESKSSPGRTNIPLKEEPIEKKHSLIEEERVLQIVVHSQSIWLKMYKGQTLGELYKKIRGLRSQVRGDSLYYDGDRLTEDSFLVMMFNSVSGNVLNLTLGLGMEASPDFFLQQA